MPYTGPAKVIPNEPTKLGMPIRTLQYPNGSRSYIYGDFLPKTPEERQERELEIARVIERIMLNNAARAAEGQE